MTVEDRFLGLDFGDKTIGVALSDGLGLTAQGIETIRRQGETKDLARLAALVEENAVTGFVVGLPKNMDGSLGERAQASEKFARFLTERFPGKQVVMWDERLTTVAAQKMLIEADVSRQKRKKVVDKLAAVLILQGYLDSKKQRLGG